MPSRDITVRLVEQSRLPHPRLARSADSGLARTQLSTTSIDRCRWVPRRGRRGAPPAAVAAAEPPLEVVEKRLTSSISAANKTAWARSSTQGMVAP
jgi:hypothetical protein